jgi:2'-deoxycytidine 5'-triphosphate deaminase (DCD)
MSGEQGSKPLFGEASDAATTMSSSAKVGTGVLPYQGILSMIRAREMIAVPDIEANQVQPASMDLRLGRYAYRVRASFLPGANATVMDKVKEMDGYPPLDLAEGAVLERFWRMCVSPAPSRASPIRRVRRGGSTC